MKFEQKSRSTGDEKTYQFLAEREEEAHSLGQISHGWNRAVKNPNVHPSIKRGRELAIQSVCIIGMATLFILTKIQSSMCSQKNTQGAKKDVFWGSSFFFPPILKRGSQWVAATSQTCNILPTGFTPFSNKTKEEQSAMENERETIGNSTKKKTDPQTVVFFSSKKRTAVGWGRFYWSFSLLSSSRRAKWDFRCKELRAVGPAISRWLKSYL